jgi:hypothetical protein
MHANIDGLKIHPVSTEKPLPILTSPKDKNTPTTHSWQQDQGIFFIQNQYSLVPKKEEFGSDLSDHNEDNINSSGTTIELGKDAKALLAKEMKGKVYDLEGIKSRSSKQTHHTNMTGKTGMILNQSVTTKKFARDFSQQKRDLNAEQKKSAALEQCLKDMESTPTAGIIPTPPHMENHILLQNKIVSISVPSTTRDSTLAQTFDSQLNLPPTHEDTPATMSSTPMANVGR